MQPGLYRHYKGQEYRVLAVARHSETEEELVIYQALYGEFGLWVRPLSMFIEAVEVNGERVPRFALVSAEDDPLGLQTGPSGETQA
ncbi:MAG: TonB box-like protein [Pseudomonas sp.]|nr:MAG: TonB box-like protein [Pseudomonas sp.]